MEAESCNYPPAPASMDTPVVVVSSFFCAPNVVDLAIVSKLLTVTEGDFAVTDLNGNSIFKIKGSFSSIRERRVLADAAGNPIVSLQQKILTAHSRWQVFRGDSSSSHDLIFSAKKSHLFHHFKTELDVFLESNTKEDAWDFKVKGSWLEKSCTVYARDEENIIAQMHKKHSVQSIVLGQDHFNVTVYPNVDHAFIVALVVILEEINEDRSNND